MRRELIEDRRQGHRHPPRPPDQQVRVLVADHDGLARSMLRSVLAGSPGVTIVAATATDEKPSTSSAITAPPS